MAKRPLKISENDELFELMTEYANLSDSAKFNRRRAEIIGIEAEGTTVAPGAIVRVPTEQIGKGVFIGLYCYINGNVTVEDDVLIGPHCSIVAGNHKFDPATGWFSARTEGDGDESVVIGRGSWLASGVTVTPGVKLGKCNLVCSGAVVTKSTPDYAIMAGVPARCIGRINAESGEYEWFKEKK